MLSVAIIARDAANNLPACLASVTGLTDDIVVVIDDRTTDSTAEVAKNYGARVFIRKFSNFASQKNYAASQCKYDWILSLDADEYVSPQLASEIKNLDFSLDAYQIPRLNYIFGKPIYHSNWEPSSDTHVWLFNKTKSRWKNEVHEEVEVNGRVGKLNNFKIHKNYKTVEEFISKMNRYTSLETKLTNPIYDFLRRYIWHKGFLDSWHGLFLSYLMMIYHTTTWVKKKVS